MSIKIQLDVPALERLIKDDKQMEVELKQGVIMNFVDKHLRKLLKDDLVQAQIKDIGESVRAAIDLAAAEEIGKVKRNWMGRIDGVTIHPEFERTLSVHAKAAVADSVQGFIRERIEAYMSTNELDKYIERAVAYKLSDLTKAEVQRRADEAMKKI